MTDLERFDAVVVGSGEAGKWMTWHLGGAGKRVAVVERRSLGGACPNIACLPSKNVIYSAKVASYLRRQREFGLPPTGTNVDMTAVHRRKMEMVAMEKEVHETKFAQSKAEVVWGAARFVGPKTFEVTAPGRPTRRIAGDQVFLDTGSRATIDPTPGLALSAPLTHVEALDLEQVPAHLAILGGGYVGLEFAQALRRLGSRVTVVERSARLLPREDPDVSEAMAGLFESEGIDVALDTHVAKVEGRSGERVALTGTRDGKPWSVEATHLLVATGRTPNTDAIDAARGGVELTDRGLFRVNERLETTAPGVWALGDCAGSPLFTHISFEDFRIVRDNLAGGNRRTTGRQVPSCLFTDPELARVGLNETEAAARGIPYRVAKIPMSFVLRTHTMSEMRGFLKALVGAKDDRILGYVGFGANAGELLPVVQLAMAQGLDYGAVRDLVVAHPTIGEGNVVLFSSVPPRRA